MIRMQLSDAAGQIGASFSGPDGWFNSVSTDSRSIRPGELYCALRGTNFDGHDFCSRAEQAGALGAIVERVAPSTFAQLEVTDSRIALGELASAWRRRFELPIVGVTGSNGKTTVKEMIASILSVNSSVLSTRGNLNNEVGVPQTLFRLNDKHDYAVIEMGASHVGEIQWLARIAQPQVGVITLCAPAHIEGFGTVERIAQAKGELYAGLATGGTAVINADDEFASYWCKIADDKRILRFGKLKSADVCAQNISVLGVGKGVQFDLQLPNATLDIALPFDGSHNVSNALAAAAVAYALDISSESIKRGLESATKVEGRLCVYAGQFESKIIDDSYNANPASLAAAVELLGQEDGETCLILGDMGELGSDAIKAHRDAGAAIRHAGIDRLYTLGDLSTHAATEFGRGAQSFRDIDGLLSRLHSDLTYSATILVKGSRFMRMERIVQALAPEARPC